MPNRGRAGTEVAGHPNPPATVQPAARSRHKSRNRVAQLPGKARAQAPAPTPARQVPGDTRGGPTGLGTGGQGSESRKTQPTTWSWRTPAACEQDMARAGPAAPPGETGSHTPPQERRRWLPHARLPPLVALVALLPQPCLPSSEPRGARLEPLQPRAASTHHSRSPGRLPAASDMPGHAATAQAQMPSGASRLPRGTC